MATWIKAAIGSHDEDRLSTHGRPTARASVHPPGLGQREDSPQHQGVFFLLSSCWQQL